MNHWIPQVIVIVLMLVNQGVAIERSGKTREVHDVYWIDLLSFLITVSLLYWGGFFNSLLGK